MPAATSTPKSHGMVELSESDSKVGSSTTSRPAAPWGDEGGAGGAVSPKSDISVGSQIFLDGIHLLLRSVIELFKLGRLVIQTFVRVNFLYKYIGTFIHVHF